VFSRFNLTAVLAVLAILDLLVDRLLSRLFLPSGGGARAWSLSGPLAGLGSFLSYLAGALALLLFASSFVGLIRRRELYPRSMRLVVSVLALVFVGLLTCALATFQPQGRLFVQLKTTHAFLATLTAVALWAAPVSARAKLGVTLFALPPVLHTAALFISEMGWTRGSLAPDLARIGELLAFLAAGSAPLLLPPALRGARFGIAAWVLGLFAVTLLVAGLLLKFDLVQVLALYGLRLDLPPLAAAGAWAYGLLFALAVLGTFLVVLPGLGAGGSDRLIAYGVIMIVTAGYQVASPADLGVSTCGLLALALGVVRRPFAPEAHTPAPVLSASAEAPAPATP
jgi:hypothetical protein